MPCPPCGLCIEMPRSSTQRAFAHDAVKDSAKKGTKAQNISAAIATSSELALPIHVLRLRVPQWGSGNLLTERIYDTETARILF